MLASVRCVRADKHGGEELGEEAAMLAQFQLFLVSSKERKQQTPESPELNPEA